MLLATFVLSPGHHHTVDLPHGHRRLAWHILAFTDRRQSIVGALLPAPPRRLIETHQARHAGTHRTPVTALPHTFARRQRGHHVQRNARRSLCPEILDQSGPAIRRKHRAMASASVAGPLVVDRADRRHDPLRRHAVTVILLALVDDEGTLRVQGDKSRRDDRRRHPVTGLSTGHG